MVEGDNRKKILESLDSMDGDGEDIEEYKTSISYDGRHLLCRIPRELAYLLDLFEETDKPRPKGKYEIVFTNVDEVKKTGEFEIRERNGK